MKPAIVLFSDSGFIDRIRLSQVGEDVQPNILLFQRSHEVLDVDCIAKLTWFDVVMRPPGSDLEGGAGCVPVKASSYHLTYHQNF
jgi:hypothetical protein